MSNIGGKRLCLNLEVVEHEKDLGVYLESSLKPSKQCITYDTYDDTGRKAKSLWFRSREGS